MKTPVLPAKNIISSLKSQLFLLFFFIIFGFTLSQIAGSALFVKRIGANMLPITYIFNSFLGIAASLWVTSKINKTGVVRLIKNTALVAVFGEIFSLILIFNSINFGLYFLVSFNFIIYAILSILLMWDLAIKLISPYQARSLFGFFSLGASLGGISAGLLANFLHKFFPSENLIFGIVISQIVVIFVVSVIGNKHQKQLHPVVNESSESLNAFSQTKSAIQEFKKNKLAQNITFAIIIFQIVFWLADFIFQRILGSRLTESEFLHLSSLAWTIENVALIIIFALIQKRLLNKIGVVNTILTAPGIALIPFVTILFYPGVLSAVVLRTVIRVMRFANFSSPLRLTYTAIPQKVRSKIVSLFGLMAESISIFIVGMILLFVAKSASNLVLGIFATALLVLLILLIFRIKKLYVLALVKNLHSNDPNDCHTAIENFAEPGYRHTGVSELMKLLKFNHLDSATIRKIIFSLGKMENAGVIQSLIEIFKNGDYSVKYAVISTLYDFKNLKKQTTGLPFSKMNLVELYKEILLSQSPDDLKIMALKTLENFDSAELVEFLTNYLKKTKKRADFRVKNEVIKTMGYFHDRGIYAYVKPFLSSKEAQTKASAISALWQFKEMRPDLLLGINNIMQGTTKQEILASLELISTLSLAWESRYVEKMLSNDDPEIKNLAALTFLKLEDERGVNTAVENLITPNIESQMFTQSLNNFPEKIKNQILEQIKMAGESAINTAIEKLQKIYINLSDEIKFLRGE